MLKLLVEANQEAHFTIIEDNLEDNGKDLFITFLKKQLKNESVKLLCFEYPPQFYTKNYEIPSEVCIDFYFDSCGWNKQSPNDESWAKTLIKNYKLEDQVLFIDSISLLVMRNDFYKTYCDLFELVKLAKHITALVHGDVLSGLQDKKKLMFLSNCYLTIGKINSKNKVDILFKKPGGKVVKQSETFLIKDGCIYSCIVEEKKKEIPKCSNDDKEEFESLTTFKLGLEMSDSEKTARSQLVLPYLRKNKAAESKIIYEAEPDDDLEDDPDEDLDI